MYYNNLLWRSYRECGVCGRGTLERPEGWDYVGFSQAIQALRETNVGEPFCLSHLIVSEGQEGLACDGV